METHKQRLLHTLVKFILPTIIAPAIALIILDTFKPIKGQIFLALVIFSLFIIKFVRDYLDYWNYTIALKSICSDNQKYQEALEANKDKRTLKQKLFSKNTFLRLLYFIWFSLMIFIYIAIAFLIPAFVLIKVGIDPQSENILLGLSWIIIFFIIRPPLNKIDKFINEKLGKSEKLYEENDSIKLFEVLKMDENKLLNITIFILVLFTIFLIYKELNKDGGYYYFTVEDERENEIGRYYSFHECIKDEAIYRQENFLDEDDTTECKWKQ